MLRGAFIRADGLIIPNNITLVGSGLILRGALRREVIPMAVALANCVPDPALTVAQLNEPTGVNGYARIPVTQDAAGWPGAGTLNGEQYLESGWLTWTAVGGAFDKPVNRMAIVSGADVFCVSGAFPAELTIQPTTVEVDRKFKYRIYQR